jgi:hypothetical protein
MREEEEGAKDEEEGKERGVDTTSPLNHIK